MKNSLHIPFFAFLISFFLLSIVSSPNEAHALIQFQDDLTHDIESEGVLIDFDDNGAASTFVQFGNNITSSGNGVLIWDIGNAEFQFTNGVGGSERSNLSFEIETVSALPGGVPGLGAAGEGRLVILDTADSIAPGCTISPFCSSGTYVWDGGAWISLVGQTSSNLTKVVTVNPGGGEDYLTIEDAANYLQTRSGGFMLLSASTHTVTTDFDVDNVTIIGKDPTRTTIQISGLGQMNTFDTKFQSLTIDVNAITDDMALDVQAGSSALEFVNVDFDVLDLGDSLIDSNEGVAPTLTVRFQNTATVGGSGDILKTIAGGNLNAASSIFVDARSGDNPLEINDWDVVLAGDGAVNTTGTIFPIPADSIFVTPQMNLQGAIDSLEAVGNGGVVTIAPGTHNISQTLTIEDDDIRLVGFGDASVIETSGTFVATGSTIGAIQVGTEATPIDGVQLTDFRLRVNDNIHGIRVTGGEDNRVVNVTVRKVTGTSGSGDATADIGILMMDGTAQDLVRPVVSECRIFGNGGGNYFTDGIHVSSDGDAGGVFGNGNNVINALVEGNNVDFVAETAYAIVGADDSSLFNNRASGMGQGGGGAFGIYISNATHINMTANVFSGSASTAAIGVGIESFNLGSLKTVDDSIFTSNVVDGSGNGGVGFATGFQIGNAANTDFSRNILQNNTINGAIAGASVAMDLRGNADDNSISNNSVDGGVNPWDTGVNLQSATQERNLLRGNSFVNVTNWVSDAGTSTQYGVGSHRATVNPTINDDIGDGYSIGVIWINTTTDSAFLLQDNTLGAAVWDQIDGAVSSTTLNDAYINGSTISVDDTDGDLIFNLTQAADFVIQDNGITFATFTDGGDFNITNNFTVGSATETISDAGFLLNGDDVFIAGQLGVEGQVYSDAYTEKYKWFAIGGAVRSSASLGSVAGGNSPVIRFDATSNSRARWSFPVPQDMDVTQNAFVDVYWSPATGAAGGEQIEYMWRYAGWAPGDTVANAEFTGNEVQTQVAVPATTLELVQTSFTITANDLALDEIVNIRISREDPSLNVDDDYLDEISIHAVRLRYQGKAIQ